VFGRQFSMVALALGNFVVGLSILLGGKRQTSAPALTQAKLERQMARAFDHTG
jgi:hypothetical protein